MSASVRRFGASVAAGLAILAALPGAVAACTGPACGDVEPAPDGAQGIILVAILVVFGAVMAIAEVRDTRRRH